MILYFVFRTLSIICYGVRCAREDFSRTDNVLSPGMSQLVCHWSLHTSFGTCVCTRGTGKHTSGLQKILFRRATHKEERERALNFSLI